MTDKRIEAFKTRSEYLHANQRRIELINTKYAGGLMQLEETELAFLQERVLAHVNELHPLLEVKDHE